MLKILVWLKKKELHILLILIVHKKVDFLKLLIIQLKIKVIYILKEIKSI